MSLRLLSIRLLAAALPLLVVPAGLVAAPKTILPPLTIIRAGDNTVAAVVDERARLFHTPQIFAKDAKAAIEQIDQTIRQSGADPDAVAKLNVAATTQAHADAARAEIRRRYPAESRPPVSFVIGALPSAGATIGIDAVVAATTPEPMRPIVYVSGQAEKGATPAESAARTIAGLVQTLEFLGAQKRDVVQARCFLNPMSAADEVIEEFEKVFGGGRFPIVFVEWKSDLPIEIELIAAAPPAPADAPALEYLTPPEVKPSPLFARVVRVNRGNLVYTAGLYAKQSGTGAEQVGCVFEQLRTILMSTGSDPRHLVKATYLVSDAEASKHLNVLRPKFYDPQRPPAASKAMVPGTGMNGRSILIDMIGVVVAPDTH